MKHYLGPLLCALVAACSTNREPASSYDASRVEADDTEQELVPASSDAVERATDQPASARDDEPAPNRGRSQPDSAPPTKNESAETPSSRETQAAPPDNTKVNQRDSDGSALTPIDQGNNERDLETTQQIRKAVVGDDSLSFSAKNVKIITVNGKVTLRGPVKSAAEREKIAAMARKVAGAANVDNRLEVVK